nr:hypothetical protein Iba_chr15cCG9120 [Ipomoea batatas]
MATSQKLVSFTRPGGEARWRGQAAVCGGGGLESTDCDGMEATGYDEAATDRRGGSDRRRLGELSYLDEWASIERDNTSSLLQAITGGTRIASCALVELEMHPLLHPA